MRKFTDVGNTTAGSAILAEVKLAALARKAGWNLGDQITVALTNVVMTFLVANTVDAPTYGAFTLAFTVFALVIGGVRAVSTSPLAIRFSDVDDAERRRSAALSTGTTFTIAVACGLVCALVGLAFGEPLRGAFVALGAVLPLLCVQDAYRYVFFARSAPKNAFLADVLWAVAQIGGVLAVVQLGLGDVATLLVVWGVSAGAAAVLSIVQAGVLPAPRSTPRWLKEHRDLTGYLFASFATAQGVAQGATLLIGAIASVQTVGSLGGAQRLLGPTTILATATFSFAVPEFVRRRDRLTDRQWMIAAAGVSAGVAGLGGLWGAFFLLTPDAVGASLLSETWPGTREILLFAVLTQIGAAASNGPVVMLYALDRASSTLTIQLVLGVLTFAGGTGGALLGQAVGAQIGLGIAAWAIVPFWFARLWRELGKRDRERAAGTPEPDAVPATSFAIDDFATMSFTATSFTATSTATMVLPAVAPRRRPPPPRPAGPDATTMLGARPAPPHPDPAAPGARTTPIRRVPAGHLRPLRLPGPLVVRAGEDLVVGVTLVNTLPRPHDHVLEIHLARPGRPGTWFAGRSVVRTGPGAAVGTALRVPAAAFTHRTAGVRGRSVAMLEPGRFRVLVGVSGAPLTPVADCDLRPR